MTEYKTFDDLLKLVEKYIHKPETLELIKKAYDKAAFLHKDQYRKSGEPYIIHPLNVACILAELHVGPDTIVAGLLHDTVEDTNYSLEDCEKDFSKDISELVDGVTKISSLKFTSLEEKQATNHQHILLAMAKDIRVIIVKLADRLHNIRTLDSLNPEKQVRIANETLEIYAPLAHKLGMFRIKAELEDTSLKYVDPQNYAKIMGLLKNDSSARLTNVDYTISEISKLLDEEGIKDYKIKGRIKNTYSIYKKMVTQNKEFNDLYDILAVRVIVHTIPECYQVLGLIHSKYTPVPKRFKDYIAVPKPNMYQSLHTTVINSKGFTFEVQIRTIEMDNTAELGIAAHWAYKENATYNKEREQFEIASKLKWYGDLLKFSEEEKDEGAKDYVDAVKGEILMTNVYVYTPSGEVIDLPKGATPIDFAYKIHTNVGNQTVGAIVNNKIVTLDYELQNGDIIEIKRNKNSFGPSPAWLNIAKTTHAIHKIKSFLNKQEHDVDVSKGKETLNDEFKLNKIENYELDDKFIQDNLSKNNVFSLDDVYLAIGKGNLSAKTVVQKYIGVHSPEKLHEEVLNRQIKSSMNQLNQTSSETGIIVDGLTNPQLKLGSCCNPIPGDEIVGYVTKGNGIVAHNKNCRNLNDFERARLIKLRWADGILRKYPVGIKIEASESINLLVDIMNTVAQSGMSILAINAKSNTANLSTVVKLKVMTKNLAELETLIINLKKVKNIYNIERENL